ASGACAVRERSRGGEVVAARQPRAADDRGAAGVRVMSDAALRELARAAGIAVAWEDHRGKRRRVSVAVLRRVLAALGLPCDNADGLRHCREMVRTSAGTRTSPVITATVGEAIAVADAQEDLSAPLRLMYEDGTTADVRPRQSCSGKWLLPPI